MHLLLTAALLLSLWLMPTIPAAQPLDASQRAREIATLFNKSKHKVKEKRGIRIEVHVEVTSEPVVKKDAREYSGTYNAFDEYALTLRASADGHVEASGAEPGPKGKRNFTLRDARVENALVTGTKVYDDGATEKFEAVFLNRTVQNGQTNTSETTFGLGVLYDPPKTSYDEGFVLNKLFYEVQR